MDTNQAGGAALVAGFVLVLLLLYRDPARGLAATTADARSALYFFVLPITGLLAGAYAYANGPYSAFPLFLLASYLGVFGLALTIGGAPTPSPVGFAGVVLLALSLVALVASVLHSAALVDLGILRPPSN